MCLDDLPDRPSLAAAVAHCLECLDVTLPETVPADPRVQVPVRPVGAPPAAARPGAGAAAVGRPARRAPAEHPVHPVGSTVHRHDDDGLRLRAEDDDLRDP